MVPNFPEFCFAQITSTSTAGQVTVTFLPKGRKLALEDFKYAFKSWRQTPAVALFSNAQLFMLASTENIFLRAS
jgi:hypothetical protein